MKAAARATRNNFRDFGAPREGIWFGRGRAPEGYGVPVTLERVARRIDVRHPGGHLVDSFGDTGKFWLTIGEPTADELAAEAARVAAARQRADDVRRARLAEYATRPVPATATWVFDSETGAKVGYLTDAGVVLIEQPTPTADLEPAPTAPTPVVIVPCGGVKAAGTLPAGEKYIGSYHRMTRKAAAAIAARTGARVLILSALYGLLELDNLVDDYDLRMGEPGSVTAGRIAEQAAILGITDALVTVIAGRAYANVVTAVWPHAVRVLDGTNGMPHQMKRMADVVRGEWKPALTAATGTPALFGADLVAPPALELSAAADLRRGDVLAPGTFGVAGTDPVLVVATSVPAGELEEGVAHVALMVRPLTFPGRGKYVAVPADYGVDVTGYDEVPASVASSPQEYPLPPIDRAERVAAGELEYVPAAQLRAGDLVAPGGFGPWNTQDTITVTAAPVLADQVAGVDRYDVATVVNLPAGPGPETHGALSAASFVPVVARGPAPATTTATVNDMPAARPVVLVAPARGASTGPLGAEVLEDNAGETTVLVAYCHNGTRARIARRRILGPIINDHTTVPVAQLALLGDPLELTATPAPQPTSADAAAAEPPPTRSPAARPDLHTDTLPIPTNPGHVSGARPVGRTPLIPPAVPP